MSKSRRPIVWDDLDVGDSIGLEVHDPHWSIHYGDYAGFVERNGVWFAELRQYGGSAYVATRAVRRIRIYAKAK